MSLIWSLYRNCKSCYSCSDWLIDSIVFYAVSAIFQPYNGGMCNERGMTARAVNKIQRNRSHYILALISKRKGQKHFFLKLKLNTKLLKYIWKNTKKGSTFGIFFSAFLDGHILSTNQVHIGLSSVYKVLSSECLLNTKSSPH